MDPQESNTSDNTSASGSRDWNRYRGWNRRAYTRKCKLCGGPAYDEYCKVCDHTLFQIDEILRLYLEGTPPEAMDKAIAEFDRIYFSNLRLRVFYNTACEAVYCVMMNPNSPLTLFEPKFSKIPEPKVLAILEESGIISREGENIVAGPLLKKLIRLRLTGYLFTSEDFSKQLGIVYAILTLTVTRTLLKHEEFIPQIVVGIFRVISAHVFRNMSSTSVPKEIPRSTWDTGFKGINPREEVHVKWDLLGLTPNTNPRIFENYDPEKEHFVSKECMV
ncbi:hypothetical protein MUP77_19295, partial [Candidatus Bathyarchaeota archaeon]|nr:hypothetical protein [Candidatus Bathyarchaeota archaeon]